MSLDKVVLSVGPGDWAYLDDLVKVTADIVGPAGAMVDVLYVFPREDYDEILEQMDVDQTSGGLSPDEVAERHESVEIPVTKFEQLGIDFRIHGAVGGTPASKIVSKTEEFGADMVVVSGSKRSPTGKAMFGDSAQQVLLNAPCPVLYIKQE